MFPKQGSVLSLFLPFSPLRSKHCSLPLHLKEEMKIFNFMIMWFHSSLLWILVSIDSVSSVYHKLLFTLLTSSCRLIRTHHHSPSGMLSSLFRLHLIGCCSNGIGGNYRVVCQVPAVPVAIHVPSTTSLVLNTGAELLLSCIEWQQKLSKNGVWRRSHWTNQFTIYIYICKLFSANVTFHVILYCPDYKWGVRAEN